MMNTILYSLFEDNPRSPGELNRFCREMPGYLEARQEFDQAADQVIQLVGYRLYARLEEAMNAYQAYEVRAGYFFGLGLRQELLAALNRDQT